MHVTISLQCAIDVAGTKATKGGDRTVVREKVARIDEPLAIQGYVRSVTQLYRYRIHIHVA